MTRTDPICRSLAEVPGVGPVIATAFAATVPDAHVFHSGRHLAAWLGLVPGQHATGGKQRLLGISKRGDGYLRRQLIHGARSLVWVAQAGAVSSGPGSTRCWRADPFNVVVAAVANKLARILWAMLAPRRGLSRRGVARRHATDELPRAARANVEVMAYRSDRGRQNPWWSTSFELVRMIGRRSADLIKASGQPAAPTGRMDGSSRDRLSGPRKKPLQSGRRPWMDHPKKELTPKRLIFG